MARSFHCRLVALIALVALLACGLPVSAQDSSREIAELRAQLQQLRAEVDALKALVAASPGKTASAEEPDPVVEMLQQQVADHAQVKVESKSKMPVTLFGTILSNTAMNTGEANWLENPNIVAVPNGPTGSFVSTLKQTQLGLSVAGPTIGAFQSSGFVAVDFLGGAPGFQTGTVMGLPRLLYAFARFENDRTALEVGQDSAILAPRDPTSLAAPSFPLLFRSGNLYLRAPQIRVEQQLGGGLNVRAGIITPLAGDFGPDYVFAPPAGAGERSRVPAVQARLGFDRGDIAAGPVVGFADPSRRARALQLGVSGHYGRERGRGAAEDDPWAAAFDWNLQAGAIGFGGEAFVGRAIDAFGGALGQSVRAAGGFAEIRIAPTARLSVNGGAGIDRVDDDDRRRVALRGNRSVFGNVIFAITPEVATGIEYRHLSTEVSATGRDRRNHHVNVTFAYSF